MQAKVAFGMILKDLRANRGLSQQELASEAQVDRACISLLESGKRHPTLFTLLALARALQTTASELVAKVEAELAQL